MSNSPKMGHLPIPVSTFQNGTPKMGELDPKGHRASSLYHLLACQEYLVESLEISWDILRSSQIWSRKHLSEVVSEVQDIFINRSSISSIDHLYQVELLQKPKPHADPDPGDAPKTTKNRPLFPPVLRTFLCFGRLARLGADGNSEPPRWRETSENNGHVELPIEAVPLNTRGVLGQIIDILL